MAPPSCRRLTPGGMGLARGAQQEEAEPDCGRLCARSIGVVTRTCYGTIVKTDQPKWAERLGPKGHGPKGHGLLLPWYALRCGPGGQHGPTVTDQRPAGTEKPQPGSRGQISASRWSAVRQVMRWDLPRSQGLG